VAPGSWDVDGSQGFVGCSTGSGGLAGEGPLLFAACGRNGTQILTAVNPQGGRLAKEYAFRKRSFSYPITTDGLYTLLANDLQNGLLEESEETLASGGLTSPSSITAYPATGANWLSWIDGAVFFTGISTVATLNAYDLSQPNKGWGSALGTAVNAGGGGAYVPSQPQDDKDYLWLIHENSGGNTVPAQVDGFDVRNPAAITQVAQLAAASTTPKWNSLALYRQRLYASGQPQFRKNTIDVWDVTDPRNVTPKTSVDVSTIWNGAGFDFKTTQDVAVYGPYAFLTWKTDAPSTWGLAAFKLGATDRDGNGATLAWLWDSGLSYALGTPVVVGDTLYVRQNMGLATFDLTPLFRSGAAPTYRSSTNVGDLAASAGGRFFVDGALGYMMTDGDYRIFDLR
jgi:hypothetical protein